MLVTPNMTRPTLITSNRTSSDFSEAIRPSSNNYDEVLIGKTSVINKKKPKKRMFDSNFSEASDLKTSIPFAKNEDNSLLTSSVNPFKNNAKPITKSQLNIIEETSHILEKIQPEEKKLTNNKTTTNMIEGENKLTTNQNDIKVEEPVVKKEEKKEETKKLMNLFNFEDDDDTFVAPKKAEPMKNSIQSTKSKATAAKKLEFLFEDD